MKFIVVTGGVISSIGKGICASSICLLYKSLGFSVTAIKIDPYLNCDAGTLSPYEHGETYVLGTPNGECDLDLGNYERFCGLNLTRDHNITSGKIYSSVIQKERKGEYLGKTVQIVPHIVDEIQNWILRASKLDVGFGDPEICVIELGGTIGDIETAPFVEALTRLSLLIGRHNICFTHVSLIIDINGELKTKPTQHSIRTLRSLGITPDLLILRTKGILNKDLVEKISINCAIKKDHIISNIDVPNIYYVPDLFKKQLICEKISNVVGIPLVNREYELSDYYNVLRHFERKDVKTLNIGIAGKYVGSQDTYLSLIRAIEHASFKVGCHVNIVWIDTEKIETGDTMEWKKLCNSDRVIIPGGFGTRGIDGKIDVCKYCRINNVKMLGICLGFQVQAIEYARSIGFTDATSREWSLGGFGLINMLPDQNGIMGGTMRLGNQKSKIIDEVVQQWYGSDTITERHRHRYELEYHNGLIFNDTQLMYSAVDQDSKLVEIIRLKDHPFFVGCQFHPEFNTHFNKPHPLFVNLLL